MQVVVDTPLGILKDFLRQLPHFRVTGSFLFFGIYGGGHDGEEILADGFNAVLAALIVLQRLPAHGHDIQDSTREAATGAFDENQLSSYSRMLEFGS